MFGDFICINQNKLVEKVEFRIQKNAYFSSANARGLVIIKTPTARVYINDDSYFAIVPESAWQARFSNEDSPETFLRQRIGKILDDTQISEFQNLLEDLIDAEFESKN